MAFTFGGADGNKSLFGQNSSAQPGNLFGSTSAAPSGSYTSSQNQPATSGPSTSGLFSGASAASTAKPGGLFGGVGTTNSGSAPSTTNLFGNITGNTSGGAQTSNQSSTPTTSAASIFGDTAASSGSVFSFNASNPNDKATSANSGSLFAGLKAPSYGITNTITTLAGSTTPAKTVSFNTSTTPAGPPPTENGQAAKPLFGSAQSSTTETGKTFSGVGTATTSGLFTTSKPAGGFKFTAPSNTIADTASSNAPKQALSSAGSTSAAAPAAQAATTTSGLFSGLKATPVSGSGAPSMFSGFYTGGSAPALFGGAGVTSTNSSTTQATTSAPVSAASISSIGGTGSKAGTTSTSAAESSATSSAAPAPTTLPSQTTSTTTIPNISSTGAAATKKLNTDSSFGSSTIGPAPQLTRLKNKTMDEIITRWASDLSKYQKEFQEQATKVAAWDRLLVENGDKIQKLYLSTFEAERQSAEIERQLLTVESQQDELASWLDRYEAEVDEMFTRQVGQGDMLQGPDQERERTYKLAEKLTDRLDEMGKNLTSMIDAINDASTTLSRTGKADDPLSGIVRVLNNHLSTLQWIDENAEALKAKVDEAQKMGQSMGSNGYGGPEMDSADSFYRSIMRRK